MALACGHDPGEPLELQPGPWASDALQDHTNGFFLIARGCLEDEEPGGDITGSTGRVADPDKRAVKHLALHKTRAASLEQVAATPVAFPWVKAAPMGHQGHCVPVAEQAVEAAHGDREGRSPRTSAGWELGKDPARGWQLQHLHSPQHFLDVPSRLSTLSPTQRGG